jgi:hypothetical protein
LAVEGWKGPAKGGSGWGDWTTMEMGPQITMIDYDYITICNWNRTGTKQIQCITHRFLLVEILRLKPGVYHFI